MQNNAELELLQLQNAMILLIIRVVTKHEALNYKAGWTQLALDVCVVIKISMIL